MRRDDNLMRIDRGLLYTGVFLVAIGAVVVAADVGAIDTAGLTDALRLWPLAVIAIGASLVLRRSRFSLQGGMLAATLPGLVLGSALAVAPTYMPDCDVETRIATRQAVKHLIEDTISPAWHGWDDVHADLDLDTVDSHPMGGCS
jgi:hypothetical protein